MSWGMVGPLRVETNGTSFLQEGAKGIDRDPVTGYLAWCKGLDAQMTLPKGLQNTNYF